MLTAVFGLFYLHSLYVYGTQTRINRVTMPGDLHFLSSRKLACMP